VSRHAPDGGQELSHHRDDGDLARFARAPKSFVILPKPWIASHGIENHHPERLAQASVSEWNCWTAGETPLARLPQTRRNAYIARDRTSVAKSCRVSELAAVNGPTPSIVVSSLPTS
jgi:hypothetical protein